MSDERKPWAEPGLSIEERASRIADEVDGSGDILNSLTVEWVVEALRAARADALEEVKEAITKEIDSEELYAAQVRVLRDLSEEIDKMKDAP